MVYGSVPNIPPGMIWAAVLLGVLAFGFAAAAWRFAAQISRVRLFDKLLRDLAQNGPAVLSRENTPPGMDSLAAAVDQFAARVLADRTPDTGEADRRKQFDLNLLRDMCDSYASQDVLEALVFRLGDELSFDRVSLVEKSKADENLLTIAFWQHDKTAEYTISDSVLSAAFDIASSAGGDSLGGEVVRIANPAQPPDTQSLFAVRLPARGEKTNLLIMESLLDQRELTDFETELVLFVSGLMKSVLIRYHMEVKRSMFAASLDVTRRIGREDQSENAHLFVMPPMPNKRERIQNGNVDVLHRRLQTIHLQLESCEGMSAALGSLRTETYGAELDKLLTDACAHMALYEYAKAKEVIENALALMEA